MVSGRTFRWASSPRPAYDASLGDVPFGQGAFCRALKGRRHDAIDQLVLARLFIALEDLCLVLVGEERSIVVDLVLRSTEEPRDGYRIVQVFGSGDAHWCRSSSGHGHGASSWVFLVWSAGPLLVFKE
jgi:hypothetical protein